MAIRKGYDVMVTVGGTSGNFVHVIAAQRNVVFDAKQELNDISTKNDKDSMRRYEAGRAEFSFTVEALLDTVAARSMWYQSYFGDQWVRNIRGSDVTGDKNAFIRIYRRDTSNSGDAVETARARLSNITETFGGQEIGHYSLTFSLIGTDQGHTALDSFGDPVDTTIGVWGPVV